jgi:hypothetical protein
MNCSYCRVKIITVDVPWLGQYVVCNSCGELLRFDGADLRELTVREEEGMPDRIRDAITTTQWRIRASIVRERGD